MGYLTNERMLRYIRSEHGKAKRAAYRRSEAGRLAEQGAVKRYRQENPDVIAAHGAVARAIRKGTLTKQPCHCGAATVQAHHYLGYEREHWLDVEWLCPSHHKRAHIEEAS